LSRFDGLSPTAYFQSPPELSREVGRLLAGGSFEIVHVAYWYTLRHLPPFPRPPLWCLDTHDVFFEREELLYGKNPPRAKAEEERLLRAFDLVVAITPRDEETFRGHLPRDARIAEIGMGVDPERWSRARPERGIIGDGRDWVVFYGALGSEPNRLAVRELAERVIPKVTAAHPSASFLLLGSSPHPEVVSLGEREGVYVPGTVPDPATYLAACRIMALPLRVCSGFRTRAVEAMAAGLPIVAYPEAMEGLKVEAGQDWISVQGPEEMAENLIVLLRDENRARAMGRRAQESVARKYTWEETYARFPQVYLDLLKEKKEEHPGS
jgi:glycosyltransferase involved in cell wall biosynthesis